MELTNMKQWNEEPVVYYIIRWCSPSLNCRDKLLEIPKMCVQGYALGITLHCPRHQAQDVQELQELASHAYDMELSIANHGRKDSIVDYSKAKFFRQKIDKSRKIPTKEAMTVNIISFKISTWDKKKKVKQSKTFRDQQRHNCTLKELKEKTYLFPAMVGHHAGWSARQKGDWIA